MFWRKQIMAHRAVGNVLIAGAAILGGGGSAFARFGMLTYLYTLELTSLVMMYVGFLFATRSSSTRTDQASDGRLCAGWPRQQNRAAPEVFAEER